MGLLEELKRDGIELNADWFTFELSPDTPLDGQNLSDKYPKKYTDMSFERLNKMGSELGVEYKNRTRTFNTHRAHLAGEYVKTMGKYDEFKELCFKAYFVEGGNIADKSIMDNIINKLGLNAEEINKEIDSGKLEANLEAAWKLSQEYEVQSIPTFIINDKTIIRGIKEYQEFKKIVIDSI